MEPQHLADLAATRPGGPRGKARNAKKYVNNYYRMILYKSSTSYQEWCEARMFLEDASRPSCVTSPGGVTRQHLERAACRCSAESSAVREHQADAAGSKRTGTRLTGARLMQPAGAVRRQRCGACVQTASAWVLRGHMDFPKISSAG